MAVSRNQKQTNARARSGARSGGRRPARRRGAARGRGRKRRWLILPLALGVGALALYVLASGGRPGFLDAGGPPMDDIDDVSRLRLESVLSEAEREAKVRP